MSKPYSLAALVLALAALSGCSGGGDDNTQASSGGNNGTTATLKLALEIPESFVNWPVPFVLDGDDLVLAGGTDSTVTYTALENGPAHFGFRSNSAKARSINLSTGVIAEVAYDASSSWSPAPYGVGRGSSVNLHKLPGDKKYLLSGGYQYVATLNAIDFANSSATSISTDLAITDPTGLNVTPYFADRQGTAALGNGRIGYFGWNMGLYAMPQIAIFDAANNTFTLSASSLSMAREKVDAYPLVDGRVMLVGGFNGSWPAQVDAPVRVEIYDPASDTTTRVSDFPGSHSSGQFRGRAERISTSGICVDSYQYAIATDTWTTGCNITDRNIDGSYVIGSINSRLPDGSSTGMYAGKTTTGDLVFVLPYGTVTKVLVYSQN